MSVTYCTGAKLYSMDASNSWHDCGSGFARVDEENDGPALVFTSETHAVILHAKIDAKTGYQRPAVVILFWTDPASGTSFSLSFRDIEACHDIWCVHIFSREIAVHSSSFMARA